jgi:hypothetical protein
MEGRTEVRVRVGLEAAIFDLAEEKGETEELVMIIEGGRTKLTGVDKGRAVGNDTTVVPCDVGDGVNEWDTLLQKTNNQFQIPRIIEKYKETYISLANICELALSLYQSRAVSNIRGVQAELRLHELYRRFIDRFRARRRERRCSWCGGCQSFSAQSLIQG